MRLTLRTLLAYLDNTLEPQDAEILKAKVVESSFATKLVQRLRSGLVNPDLPALRPDAVGPNEDANAIGEYLDSTLPGEQVAEIERACLESDARLAEAAACHQILTMVLGQPAEVPPELRDRIYELPEQEIQRIAATSNRFSSLTLDDAPPVVAPFAEDITQDAPPVTPLAHPGGPVAPVGPADSGVSDAPTRLRESGVINADGMVVGQPAMAGAKPRNVRDTAIYGGNIRTSRITTWLVSLALAGVLLFALSRIFAPLLNQDKTVALNDDQITVTEDIEVPAEQVPPMVALDGQDLAVTTDAVEALPPPNAVVTDSVQVDPLSGQPEVEVAMTEAIDDSEGMAPSGSIAAADSGEDDFMDMAPPVPAGIATDEPAVTDVSIPDSGDDPPGAESLMTPEMAVDTADAAAPDAATSVDESQPHAPEIATITSDRTLLATNRSLPGDEPKWLRLKKGMTVMPGFPIVCAPTFRATMTSVSGLEVTLVGPAEAIWIADQDGESALAVTSGRILVKALRPNTRLDLALGNQLVTLSFDDVESVAAASIKYFRSPGADPLAPDNRVELAGVLVVQGSVNLEYDPVPGEAVVGNAGGVETLTTDQQWVKRGTAAPMISSTDTPPAWINPPDPTATSLQAGAREGLIELISGDQPLEMSLREATLFRRSEVAALAAQALLHMGQGDVYFGSDGILSETKQRAYWPEHFVELQSIVDRSAESASNLERSIVKMDAANAKSIFRLLTGYSKQQLEEGGDEALVNALDSEAMAVRVLALENLHKITGTTLYFRAEQDNAVRRAPNIKKWMVRLRKGDIRWP
ncbi:hypothetical protein K227x_47640 [Rubripirellula lacrimiformis]|uniref:FecR protein domain-containing protein n=1 Tax=Rubripirellula lacrimiformis TaxID=1930273 RepID=A0A517NGV1_9BACT|nr:hypothetical protein [Rubripirellula lacrimiformis]QDT06355.1 hypothetical protein K227x_47640 [Rubripirellula lacrimiformis]